MIISVAMIGRDPPFGKSSRDKSEGFEFGVTVKPKSECLGEDPKTVSSYWLT
jgi:hypothetical protein